MNRAKKKTVGRGVLLKMHVPGGSDSDSYDSMVDNGTDEDDDDEDDDQGYQHDNESPDSGHESGAFAFVRAPKPSPNTSTDRSGGPSRVAKRKVLNNINEEEHRKRLKAIKELYKPPTVEEINRLKETENYYHSNLFRMQTEAMLKEVRLPAKVGRFVQAWVEEFKEFLRTINDASDDRELLELNYEGVEFPLQLGSTEHMQAVLGKERFQYVQQSTVRIVGGSGETLRTSFGRPLAVDLIVMIPDKCFHKDDYLNLRYHLKRAHYLCTIAERLQTKANCKLATKVCFEPLKGDRLKPVLVMVPSDDKFSRKVQFRLHAIPEGRKFSKKRFLPDRNNVRPAMIGLNHLATAEAYERCPTPHYNSSILYDLRLTKNAELVDGMIQSDSVREAIILLKVWAHQRGFDQVRYGFDGGLITFFIAHLLQCKRIYNNMSSYQIIRLFWNQLAGSSWDKEGISFDPCHREAVSTFFRFFDVVFIDPLGELNLTANLSVDLYRRVHNESALAIRLLDDRKINSFVPLFLANYSVITQYDHFVTINQPGLITETIGSFAENVDRLDYIADAKTLFTRMVEKLLRKGLGKRIAYLVPLIGEGNAESCTFGICMDAAEAFNVIDKGPEAIDTVASDEFRTFWQGKTKLRRFKDGSITESCVWGTPAASIAQKRLIVSEIVRFLLKAHFDITALSYLAAQFEQVIQPWPRNRYETVEERSLAVIRAFDTLGRKMRDIEKLPLTITAIMGTDGVFRCTDPNPPLPKATCERVNEQMVFRCPKLVHATIQLEASGKWPEELVAIRRLKTAFYLQIAKGLNATNGRDTIAQAHNDYLFVFHEKYLFRFVIIHPREIGIMQEYLSDNQVTRLQKDTNESIALEMQATILPKLSSILHGLHLQHFSFGSVAAIAKRWLYAQLIDPFLWPDECTELLLASIYLNQPQQPPIQPQTGFFRWLQYLASTDWSKEMIVVNFNDELAAETLESLEKDFIEQRDTFPPLTIVTPCDIGKHGLFGRRAPSVQVLNRVTLLAKAAVDMIEQILKDSSTITGAIQAIFDPSFDGYDVIIHLNGKITEKTGVCPTNVIGKPVKQDTDFRQKSKNPAFGFDPVVCYLNELREAYRRYAIFFYDPCGGDRIAVLWRPDALEEKPFTISNINGRMLTTDATLQLNVDAVQRDFEIIGNGLVKRVEDCARAKK